MLLPVRTADDGRELRAVAVHNVDVGVVASRVDHHRERDRAGDGGSRHRRGAGLARSPARRLPRLARPTSSYPTRRRRRVREPHLLRTPQASPSRTTLSHVRVSLPAPPRRADGGSTPPFGITVRGRSAASSPESDDSARASVRRESARRPATLETDATEGSHPLTMVACGWLPVLKEGGCTSRRAAVEEAAKTVGGSVDAFHYAFGDTDAYVIIDVPDDEHEERWRASSSGTCLRHGTANGDSVQMAADRLRLLPGRSVWTRRSPSCRLHNVPNAMVPPTVGAGNRGCEPFEARRWSGSRPM